MTAPKKTPLKRAPRKRTVPDHTQEGTRVIVIATEMVECRKLKPYYKNPRIGDPDVVGKSLHINGMFKPIVVNIGSYTKRKNEILAGNHTWLGARREITWEEMVPDGKGGKVPKTFHKTPWDTILVSWVDVDEDAARKIVLEDNKSSDNSSYDEGILADIFSQANDLIGTSWQPDEVEDILASVKVNVDDAMGAVDEALHAAQQMQQEDKAERSFDAAPLGEEGNPDDYEDEYEDDEDSPAYVGVGIEKQKDELQGAFQLKEPDGVSFDGIGKWGIIRLRTDMLASVNDFPSDKLDTWGGSATADWEDEETWWFYNWSTGKTDYIKDLSKVIVSFYAHDQYFENWWWYCVDTDTEALTKRGWLKYDEITEEDTILSMDIDSREYKWSSIKSIFRDKYSGEMHRLVHRELDALVTPGHKFPLTDGQLVPVEDIRQRHYLATFGSQEQSNTTVYSDAFVELVGWAVTEGNYEVGKPLARSNRSAAKWVTIYQKNGPSLESIKQCAKQSGAKFSVGPLSERDNVGRVRIMGEVGSLIHDVSPNRVLTDEFIATLSATQRGLLIATMVAADGTIMKNGRRMYFQKDKEHIDKFVTLCTLQGIPTRTSHNGHIWVVTLKNRNTAKMQSIRKTMEQYDDVVWCPETEYGTFVCRRNGVVYVTGNTHKYVTKIINSGIKIMVTPDWSMEEEMKPAEWLWQLHRARWVGRYFQECGLKVIPNISWPEGEEGTKFLKEFILPTLPKKLPLISIQMQTATQETVDNPKAYIEAHNLVFSTLKPDAAILYASGRGRALLSKMDTGNTKLIILETHLEKVESIRGPRKAKKTI